MVNTDADNAHDLLDRAQHHSSYQMRIQHARNDGEHRILGMQHTLDGYDS